MDNFRTEDLPPKINVALKNVLIAEERPQMVFKSAWKPNSEIPTLWFAYTNLRCFLFSTRQRGKIFKQINLENINAVIAEENKKIIRVLAWGTENQDIMFPISESVSSSTVDAFVEDATRTASGARSQNIRST